MELFVGNVSYEAKEQDLKNIFLAFGAVSSVVIVTKRKRKKSRGFGFIEMPREEEAKAAMVALHGKEFMGRVLKVIPSLPKEELKKPVTAAEDFSRYSNRRIQEHPREQREPGVHRFKQDFHKRKEYKGRPRSGGFSRQRDDVRTSESSFRPRYKDAATSPAGDKRYVKPWRKQEGESKPWKRSEGRSMASRRPVGGPRPWKKTEGESRPWMKAEKGFKPWRNQGRGENTKERPERAPQSWKKNDAGFKPWQKKEGEAKAWKRPDRQAAPWRKPEGAVKPWGRAEGEQRPWRKNERGATPWRKPAAGGAKPWIKGEGQSKPRGTRRKGVSKSSFGDRRNAGRFKR